MRLKAPEPVVQAPPANGVVVPGAMLERVAVWRTIVRTCNAPEGARLDAIARWLVITRACVFPMTLNAALIGGLLAAASGRFDAVPFALAVVGLLVAHAANNMTNDFFDLEAGLDTAEYPRPLYAPHPVLSGMLARRRLAAAIVAANAADAAIAAYLTYLRGWPVLAFALAGLFISVFYVAPPIRLKYRGLGEAGVFVVWGPLMVAGTCFVAAGRVPGWVWLASLPYGLLVTTVLMGKHLDKLEQDARLGIRTLPVVLGQGRALRAVKGMAAAFYASVLALAAALGPWVLLAFGSLPRLRRVWKVFSEPRPAHQPENWPIWPLWYAGWAFWLTRRAGELFVLGLIAELAARWFARG